VYLRLSNAAQQEFVPPFFDGDPVLILPREERVFESVLGTLHERGYEVLRIHDCGYEPHGVRAPQLRVVQRMTAAGTAARRKDFICRTSSRRVEHGPNGRAAASAKGRSIVRAGQLRGGLRSLQKSAVSWKPSPTSSRALQRSARIAAHKRFNGPDRSIRRPPSSAPAAGRCASRSTASPRACAGVGAKKSLRRSRSCAAAEGTS